MSKCDTKLHRDCGLHLTAAAEEINRERSHVYLQRRTDMQLSIIRAVSLQSASYALDDWKIGVLLPTGLDIILLDIVFRLRSAIHTISHWRPFPRDKATDV